MSKIEIGTVLKYVPGGVGAQDRGINYIIRINKAVCFDNCYATLFSFLIILWKPVCMRLEFSGTLTSSIFLILKDILCI